VSLGLLFGRFYGGFPAAAAETRVECTAAVGIEKGDAYTVS